LLYHNHNMELRRVDGRLVLEMIFAQTDPRFLASELDTYWIQAGGGDPVAWCRKLKGRLPILHMKDYGVQDTWETVPGSVFKEIGKGNLGWVEICAAAEESGCRTFVVEQDANWIGGNPFESLRVSFDFVRESLCRQPKP
jgi:sugar phosphate isomerase/epimerase